MRETPPYTLAEIRMLLSQYIDGAMESDQMLGLDALLAQFPEYQAEFLKLQATRRLIQEAIENQTEAALSSSSESIPLWQAIASQLEADRKATPQTYEPEWISTYLDGEISAQDPQRQTFERQLAQNPQANQLLSELGQISEVIRQFGYRLENACNLELSAQVMTTFRAEQASSGPDSATLSVAHPIDHPTDAEWELLSVFVDESLSPREIIEATRLIESSETARVRLLQINQLSEGIQRVSKQLQTLAPDLWPQVRDALAHEQNVVPVNRPLRVHWAKRAAVPIAAGILLALLALPNLHLTAPVPANEAVPSSNAAKGIASPAMAAQPAQAQELASVPTSTIEARRVNYVTQSDAPAVLSPVSMSASKPGSPPQMTSDLRPMFDSAPVLATANAARESGSSVSQTDAVSPHKSPTSEAYLFDALSKQMPEEDISNIIGK